MKPTMTPVPRVEVVDALRGFAVMAILLVHSLEHFIFPVYPDPVTQPEWLNTLDQGVFSIIFTLFADKSYAIFALLFGFTFFVQSHNQQVKGKDFGYRFLWRMLLLAAFATINAAFFPAGDVLLLFAIVGIFLFIIRKWSDKAVLIFAIIMLLQPVEWIIYIIGLVNPGYVLPDPGVGAMYNEVAEYTEEGNLWKFLYGNITLGQKANLLWAVDTGRFIQTTGLFALGLYLGRKGFFVSSANGNRFWINMLMICAILFAPLYQLKTEIYQHPTPLISRTIGVILDMWQKLAFTFVLVSSFVLIYQRVNFRKYAYYFKYYGRMSLTNYIAQSVIGALLFFPVGLYLAPYCGYALSLLIGIVIFLFQIAFCRWWLKNHMQGPLESLWHKLTWIGSKKRSRL